MLSARAVETAKPADKVYRLYDYNGLFIEICPTGPRKPKGAKRWRFKYYYAGREKRISLGTYPAVSLAEAREKRDEARKLVAAGEDPSAKRKEAREADRELFSVVAEEWFKRQAPTWVPGHVMRVRSRLDKDVLPFLKDLKMREVTTPDILGVLRRVEARGARDLPRRIKQTIGQIMRFAVATGRADYDPTAALAGALPPKKHKHQPAITDPRELAKCLRAIEKAKGGYTSIMALRIIPYTLLRPGELRQGRWEEICWEAAQWRIPAERMKMREEHIVPLAPQVIARLKELYGVTGRGEWMFPGQSPEGGPISMNTMGFTLKRLGFQGKQTAHGFRSTASTILNEQGWPADSIERQLAHAPRDKVRAAYNRAAFMEERTKMMRAWADFLDSLKSGATVVPIKQGRKAAGGE